MFYLYQTISITAEPIWFSLTGLLFIGPGKVYNYSGEEIPPREITPRKKLTPDPPKKISELKNWIVEFNYPSSSAPRGL